MPDSIPSTDASAIASCCEELGRGGMGVVYRARHIRLERIVALKILRTPSAASTGGSGSFPRRGELGGPARSSAHRAGVRVGDHEGQPYFIMRLIEGQSLARRLADGPIPAREAATLLAPIARAMDYAHRHGVLHRDLKPSNILLDRDGIARTWPTSVWPSGSTWIST